MLELEHQHFPELPAETPCHLVLPNSMYSFTSLSRADWEPLQPLISPGQDALRAFNGWLWTEYDRQVHEDIAIIIQDAMLLLEMVASISGSQLEV